jgi:transposase
VAAASERFSSAYHGLNYFWEWTRYGVLDRIHQTLLARCREACGRERDPTAAIIDTHVAKATEKGGSIDPVGYDAGKKIKGVKRNALVDTEGHLLSVEVVPANIHDRDSAASLIGRALQKYPRLKKIFADGGYAGPKLASQLVGLPVELDIVKRTNKDAGFKVVRRRWVIERTFSWLRRNRRLMAH